MYIASRGRQPTDNTQGTKFWCHQKHLVTSAICYKFKKISLKPDCIHIFNDFIHVYSPRAEANKPLGTKFWCQQKGLITLAICCKFKKQVAQRATIAHLSPMCQHPFISNKPASKVIKNLNSFQIREQLFFQGLVPPLSAVWTCQKLNLL